MARAGDYVEKGPSRKLRGPDAGDEDEKDKFADSPGTTLPVGPAASARGPKPVNITPP